jgi:Leucine-rich repeat (LRR) protein
LPNNSSRLPTRDLVGKFPKNIGLLSELTVLVLNDNDFQGSTIPSSIGNLTKLNILNLSVAKLAGIIPTEIGGLVNAREVHLHMNDLTGFIPATIGKLLNCEELNLDQNKLSGPIPSEIGDLVKLYELYLYLNRLEVRSSYLSMYHRAQFQLLSATLFS